MKQFFILIFACLSSISGMMAQPEPAVFYGMPDTAEPIDISSHTEFYEDKSGDTLPFLLIQKQTFRPFAEKRNERTSQAERSLLVTWLKFSIRNTHPADTLSFIFSQG